jgi:hypothetical protein
MAEECPAGSGPKRVRQHDHYSLPNSLPLPRPPLTEAQVSPGSLDDGF